MPKILLVGGAGYVGCVLAQELIERGYAVRILDRFFYGRQGLAGFQDRVEIVQADMRSIPPEAFDDVNVVVNIGGLSNDPTAEYNPKANYEMNTVASVKLAQLCQEHRITRYLYASSCSIYDRGVTDEERDVLLDETAMVEPSAAYSSSKYAAERELLAMASPSFTVGILRKGTLFGFSPRMRYDLVVNTFVKDAMTKGYLTLHFGGEMWRPLVEVRDAARAYVLLLQVDSKLISGRIFNLVYRNFRISELALRVRGALAEVGIQADLRTEYSYKGVRNYRVSGRELERVLNFQPTITVEESVRTMVEEIRRNNYTDFDNPRYYNIRWMRTLEEAHQVIATTGSVF
jgi:nucleoside-diphosphate-sugar epimerase